MEGVQCPCWYTPVLIGTPGFFDEDLLNLLIYPVPFSTSAPPKSIVGPLPPIGGIEYVHDPRLAPTQEMLDGYKKNGGDWASYERRFLALMADRRIEESILPSIIENACLLCSEDKPEHCHRRLVIDYLKQKWGAIDILHL